MRDEAERRDRTARENRLRRCLARRGYRLVRTRRRRLPPGAGAYLILEFATGRVVAGAEPAPFSLSLEEAEAWAGRLGRDAPPSPEVDA